MNRLVSIRKGRRGAAAPAATRRMIDGGNGAPDAARKWKRRIRIEHEMNIAIKPTDNMKQKIYEVGDQVEVLCDHDDDEGHRIRDWLPGTVVQADEKMVAVQFLEDVYLTDGWMVPDHILWLEQKSENVRKISARKARRARRKRS